MKSGDGAASQLANVGEIVRCRGVTKSGSHCKWTSASDDPVAAPLREGSHFCFCHTRRKKTRQIEEDSRQQPLDRYFLSPRSAAIPLGDSLSQGSLAMTNRSTFDSSQKTPLTSEQLALIAENRRKASERRAERQRAAGSQVAPSPAADNIEISQIQIEATQENIVPLELSQAQLDRIKRNREEALERRRKRLSMGVLSPCAPSTQPLTPKDTSVLCSPTSTQNEDLQNAENQGSPRSRTPQRKPRRQLAPMLTASPPPLPLHLASTVSQGHWAARPALQPKN